MLIVEVPGELPAARQLGCLNLLDAALKSLAIEKGGVRTEKAMDLLPRKN
jgi:hypothetical protein